MHIIIIIITIVIIISIIIIIITISLFPKHTHIAVRIWGGPQPVV